MVMEEVAAEVVVGPHQFSTYQQTSSTQLPQLIRAVLGTVLAQETKGRPGWPPQPPGPRFAHPEPTAGPWALRYYDRWMDSYVWMVRWIDE